jgi:hypothetical protein
MEKQYTTILFNPDGGHTTDFFGDTVDECWEKSNDRGSKWFFYPIPIVVRNSTTNLMKRKIISACDGLECWNGKTVGKLTERMRECYQTCDAQTSLEEFIDMLCLIEP